MNKYLLILLLSILNVSVYANMVYNVAPQDTNDVIKFNTQGYDARLTDPEQTVVKAQKALNLAQKLDYVRGVGESYRVMGIGYYYLNEAEKSIDSYLQALEYFKKINDEQSEAKVYNNIGNLYRDNDYEQSLMYLNKSLDIAQRLKDKQLIASLYLNIGNIKYRQKSYNQALDYYDRSNEMFRQIGDSVNIIKCIQNRGVIYFYLNEYDKSRTLLLKANEAAKANDLNQTVASINLTLASLYTAENKYADAQAALDEGKTYASIIKDQKMIYDYEYTQYLLEAKRGNFKKALNFLQSIYNKDSVMHKSNESTKINLIQKQFEQAEIEREKALLLQRQTYDRQRFFGVTILAILLLAVVGLLIGNVKRKTKTNAQLTALNAEVSKQKDNLNRINHHLEEIIDERTRDLQIKNRKLQEYSSYLSHQIRGPIATLKGLINLEKEGLVGKQECIQMMDKCVSDIDAKIIEMSDMLHSPAKS